MLDPDGVIVSWNAGARRIKGYESEEIIGQHFSRFYTPEAKASGLPYQLLAKALENGSAQDEGWRVKKSGEAFWGSVLITAVRDDLGEHRGFVKITRDLTEMKRSQRMLQASEKKDRFLATLAHELRNPLAPLAPGVEMILKAPHATGRVIQIASMMGRQIDQMSRLIEDLVDLSRITTDKITLRVEPVALTDVLESALETARPLVEEKNHQLDVRLPPHWVEVAVDRHRLTQALSNLLVNAAKYTPPHGAITVTARIIGTKQLEIAVRDNGAGIPVERLESIFELFDQGEEGSSDGLGIGLTLVRKIAELHGGSIRARSSGKNQGSEFVLSMPVVTRSAEIAHEEDRPLPMGPCKVLVADDLKSAADTLALYFEMEGLQAAVAYDGQQAILLAEQQRPDVICLDLGMPGLDGFNAAARIRKLLPEAFIVALTGWGTDEDRRKSKEAGFDLHLVKPVKMNELREAVLERFPR